MTAMSLILQHTALPHRNTFGYKYPKGCWKRLKTPFSFEIRAHQTGVLFLYTYAHTLCARHTYVCALCAVGQGCARATQPSAYRRAVLVLPPEGSL